jgi:hypothetical protein
VIEQAIGPLVTGSFSALISGVGVYVAMSRRMAVLETKMDHMIEQNKLVSVLLAKEAELDKRVTVVEREQKTIWTRHDELKERVDVLEGRKE